jgi:hypothetical protein
MGAVTQTYGGYQALTLTSLASLASSATAGWRSDVIDNRVTGARDYEFLFTFPMANTAKANDAAIYPFLVPAMHNGTSWQYSDGGTATAPTAGPGTYTFGGTTLPGNFALMNPLNYTVADQVVQGVRFASQASGWSMWDGFLVFILNYSGAAFDASGQVIAYKAIADNVA